MTASRKRLICILPLCAALAGALQAQAATPDLLLSTPATPDVVEKGMHADGYSLAISAYNWGYPLVRMERVVREYITVAANKPATSYRAPLNQIGWATALASPSAKDMPTANNDTYYMSAVLDLTEPYVLSVPDTDDRYYVVDVFNMWQELEHYVGRRTTGTQAGKYVLVPPGWTGELPKDAKRLDVTTRKIWLWGRIQVKQGEDVAPILALQKQFSVVPLSGKTVNATLPALPKTDDPLGFFTELAAVLKDNPVKPADAALFAQFARIGLTEKGFAPDTLNPATRKGLEAGLKDAPYVAIASLASTSSIRNGWNWVTGLDSFGYNYPLRAMVAGPYLGGQGEREAMYPIRFTDSKNRPLTGASQYQVKLASAPPVNAFWSLTMYDANDKMLVENEINRYKVGTDTPGLKVAADGSITIPISHKKPQGENAANWLPAPKGGFYVLLRMYQPTEDVLSGKWALPQLDRVE
ncbi:DUF1254 domain-containing protein [Pseudomonas retamae]|uniref:DUF1254 domain-containing protein n=1 Tax=Pseudomonas retamae TaxID=702110 RepID=A0ABW7D5F7_9PSED